MANKKSPEFPIFELTDRQKKVDKNSRPLSVQPKSNYEVDSEGDLIDRLLETKIFLFIKKVLKLPE